ncbi:MAG: HD domain-containing protein [Eubacterium sp.]|nr:HD domain-containing protein [Eubacterium sp.]
MQFVEIKDLKPGMRLAKPIYNKLGVMLYDRNTNLTASGISSIENFNLIGLFILEPAEPLPPLSEEELRFEQFQTVYMFQIRKIMHRLQNDDEPEGFSELVQDILKHYGTLDHKMRFTQILRSSADFVYKHSISTAILSAMMANVLGYSKREKEHLVTAALLYDMGYLFVPRYILDKKDTLTEDDRRIINECRKKGFQLLYPDTNKYLFSAEALNTIQQTHTILGTESTAALQGKNFSRNALVLIVADMFDQLTAMNLHHPPISEIAAIRQLRQQPDRYNAQAISALANCIQILPSGCSVDLTNGEKAIVLVENPDNFMAPLILTIRNNKTYDLSDPETAKKIRIADIMKTMDNRIVVDEDTLKQFSSDSRLSNMLVRYQERMKKRMAEAFDFSLL